METETRAQIMRGPGNEPTPHDCRKIQAQRDALLAALEAALPAIDKRAFRWSEHGDDPSRAHGTKLYVVEMAQAAIAAARGEAQW